MKTTILRTSAALCALAAVTAVAGTEGATHTFYGQEAGLAAFGTNNTFVGRSAGKASGGTYNVYIGSNTGRTRGSEAFNTIVGGQAGEVGSGQGNVYLGYGAGYERVGDNALIIDNCGFEAGGTCNRPLVYGEFDNRRLHFDGVVGVTAHRSLALVKSQLHFSVTGADEGGWLTSAAENNFFTSSGARYDAMGGGWIQRSSDGKAVIAGSGAAGFRVLTSSGTAVGGIATPVSRLHIDYAGLMGVNTAPVAGRAINTSTGAYLSSGGVWTNASSRELKQDIHELSAEHAIQAFQDLKPVTFAYKEGGRHVGFIAEEVPALVATEDRRGLAAMDVVAVVTRVVQQQAAEIAELKALVRQLAAEVRRQP